MKRTYFKFFIKTANLKYHKKTKTKNRKKTTKKNTKQIKFKKAENPGNLFCFWDPAILTEDQTPQVIFFFLL